MEAEQKRKAGQPSITAENKSILRNRARSPVGDRFEKAVDPAIYDYLDFRKMGPNGSTLYAV